MMNKWLNYAGDLESKYFSEFWMNQSTYVEPRCLCVWNLIIPNTTNLIKYLKTNKTLCDAFWLKTYLNPILIGRLYILRRTISIISLNIAPITYI